MSTQYLNQILRTNIKNNSVIAEIGVAEGVTTLSYVDLLKSTNSIGFAIDWFCGNIRETPTHPHGYMPDLIQDRLSLFQNNLKPYIDDKTITLINKISWEAAKDFEDNFFDIVYIDAGHTYTFCKSDILAYASKVKIGGIICGDDYSYYGNLEDVPITHFELFECNNGHIGVVKAVKECFGTNFNLVGDSWCAIMTESLKKELQFLFERHTFPKNLG